MALLECFEHVLEQEKVLHEDYLRMRRAKDISDFIAASQSISSNLECMKNALYHLDVELYAAQRASRRIERAG